MRGPLKRLAEAALVGSGACRVGRRARSRDFLILAFHNVIPDGAAPLGDRSLHLPRSRFLAFLDHLQAHHEVVPLSEALRPTGHASRRPRVAITFDDAYQGAVAIGVAELAIRRLPATVFVSPSFIGGSAFWWDSFAGQMDARKFDEFRTQALDRFRGEDARIRAWAESRQLSEASLPDYARATNAEDLRAASEQEGVTLGSHTWSHPNLARLDSSELTEELTKPMEWLRAKFESVIPWLAYPYGLRSDDALAAAGRAGYEGAVLSSGGWCLGDAGRPHALPRLSVPSSLSARGFMLRASGL